MALGTTAAILGAGAIGAIGANKAASTQSRAAKNAADAQLMATRETNEMLRDFRAEDIERFAPFYEGGRDAYNALRFETGLADRPDGYAGFTATPGYDFRMEEGRRAVEAGAASRQGLMSGAAQQALLRYGQDYGTGEYQNYLGRLTGLASAGQSAAGMQGAASQAYGSQIGQNTMQGGQAAAQGIANAGNASAAGTMGMTNALTGMAGNLVGAWQYNNMLNAFAPQATAGPSQIPNYVAAPPARPF